MIPSDEEIADFPFVRRALDVYGAEGYITKSHYFDTLIDFNEVAVKSLEETGMHWIYAIDRAWVPFLKKDKWLRFTNRFGHQNNFFPSDTE